MDQLVVWLCEIVNCFNKWSISSEITLVKCGVE